MGKWSTRDDNRRRLSQAAHLIDNVIEHLMIIHNSFPESYEDHREALQAYAVALDAIKQEIEGYRVNL